jgi:hypothetical protein
MFKNIPQETKGLNLYERFINTFLIYEDKKNFHRKHTSLIILSNRKIYKGVITQ